MLKSRFNADIYRIQGFSASQKNMEKHIWQNQQTIMILNSKLIYVKKSCLVALIK